MTSDETRLFRKRLSALRRASAESAPNQIRDSASVVYVAAPVYASHMHVLNVAVPENFITLPIMTSKVAARRRCLG